MAVRLSPLRPGRPPFTTRQIPRTHLCAAGMFFLIEKFSELIGNRTRDLPGCSTVPQPTTLASAPLRYV
jgi:hypothetical protein